MNVLSDYLPVPTPLIGHRILVEYHHLALRLRCGSSLPEHTLLTCNDRTAAEGVGNADAVTVNVINELPPAQSTTMTSSLSSGVSRIQYQCRLYNCLNLLP